MWPFGKKKEKPEPIKEVKVIEDEREYTDDDFISCECGRVIPKVREKCVYCGAVNPYFIKNKKNNKKGKK